jgi:FkbM family methyltransferase
MAHCSKDGRIVACEPQESICKRLALNVELNHQKNIVIERVAVLDRPGEVALHSPVEGSSNTGMASVLPLGDWTAVNVAATTIDSLVEENRLNRLRLIKIDVEGLEGAVLLGAARTLTAQHPVILFEYQADYWGRAGTSWTDVATYLTSHGYSDFFEVHDRKLVPMRAPQHDTFNILALSASTDALSGQSLIELD